MDDNTEHTALARVPGPIIAGGCRMLPDPETDTAEYRNVRLEVQGVGIVRVTYERKFFKHYKVWHRSWLAVSAEVVQAPEASSP